MSPPSPAVRHPGAGRSHFEEDAVGEKLTGEQRRSRAAALLGAVLNVDRAGRRAADAERRRADRRARRSGNPARRAQAGK